jgi:hypothetical protein
VVKIPKTQLQLFLVMKILLSITFQCHDNFMDSGGTPAGKYEEKYRPGLVAELWQITKLGWTVLPHPRYSPVLAPSDFHLFGAPKDAIRGKRFGSDDEVVEEVAANAEFRLVRYKTVGIHALVSRWRKAVEVDGDYVEK